MQAITLGNPNLFVKGMVEAVITDPTTGNIIGYDNVSSESAVTSSVNMGEITGGFGNPLLINIPDTTRITGTLTSQAFSLQQRALTSGGKLSYNGTASFCETITASGTSLTVTKQPVKAYGQPASDTNCWCYVREHGKGAHVGTNYGVNPSSKTVTGFSAISGTQYDVFYFISMASAQVLALPASFNPAVATIRLKYGVYAKQNNSVSNGTLQGYLYFIVPRAQFTGDAGIGANQTTNSTTSYDWTAVMPDSNMMECADCGETDSDYAYYIYVPCGGDDASVTGLAVVGGGLSIAEGVTKQIPVVYVMDDGSTVTPDYQEMTYQSSATGVASVNDNGQVTGASAGAATVTITLAKSDGTKLTTTANVTVA